MTTQPQDPTPAAQPETPSPETPDPVRVHRMGWKKPDPGSQDQPQPPSLDTGTDGSSFTGADSPEMSDDSPRPSSSKSGGSRGSSRVEAKALREGIKVAVAGIGAGLHRYLVRDEYAQAVGVGLADEQDQEGIATPAAKIAGRRMGPGIVSPDVADGIELAVAVAGYLMKQLEKLTQARRLRASGATVTGFQPDMAQGPEEPPATDEQAGYVAPEGTDTRTTPAFA